jgi:hypothetical protein
MLDSHLTETDWNRHRPEALVIACSDGRLQENLDDFLHRALGITHYDRLYTPGGGGALAISGTDLLRSDQYRRECRFLLVAHAVRDMYVIFHGPAADGPEEALCADYIRKLPGAGVEKIRRQQERDADEVKQIDWGGDVRVHVYRCEVRMDDRVQFVQL